MIASDEQIFVGRHRFEHERTGVESSFCARVVREERPVTVPNAMLDPHFRDNIVVRGFPGIRFYVGVPVFDRFSRVAAVLSVIDYEPRDGLKPAQLEILLDLAQLAADRLTLMAELGAPTATFDETRGEAILVIDSAASIVHWNSAAERLLAAYADDLFRVGAHRHLPGWDEIVAAACRSCGRSAGHDILPVALVRADGTQTFALARVTREVDSCGTRFRVFLSGSPTAATAAVDEGEAKSPSPVNRFDRHRNGTEL